MKFAALSKFIPRAYFETALSGAVLAWSHGELAGATDAWLYALFVFSSTLAVYNLLRAVSMFRRVQNVQDWRTVPDLLWVPFHILLTVLAGITAIILLFFQKFEFNGILLLGVLLFITMSYRFRWFTLKGQKTALSDLPHLKSFLVAGVWTLICAMIPFDLDKQEWFLYLCVLLYFFGLSIPFDIRDYHKDAASRKTIPQVFGLTQAKTISVLFILIAHVLITFRLQSACASLTVSALIHTYLITRVSHRTENTILYRLLDLGPVLIGLSIYNS